MPSVENKQHKGLKRTLVIVITTVVAVCLVLVAYFIPKGSTENISKPPGISRVVFSEHDDITYATPVRLKIPSISVDTTIEQVGLTPDGAMGVPSSQNTVAWYKPGKHPGEKGSAVISGHFGTWDDGEQSVFDDLHTVQKGDKIYIEDDAGGVTTFVVRETRNYDKDADTSDVFKSNDGKSHLNLITCAGDWNYSQKSYTDRLVVFTDKE